VPPAGGRTLLPGAAGGSGALFGVAWAAWGEAVGASPPKQLVLLLARAGWQTSVKLGVPAHVPRLCLPPYSPELQPAEHRWPLTNGALVHQHFASTLGAGRGSTGPLRHPAAPARPPSLDDVLPLVA